MLDLWDAQIDLIRDLEREKRALENELLNLTDLSPDNAFDLKPGGKNFKATEWVDKIQDIKVQTMNLNIQLKIAKETQTEWFTDESTETKA